MPRTVENSQDNNLRFAPEHYNIRMHSIKKRESVDDISSPVT